MDRCELLNGGWNFAQGTSVAGVVLLFLSGGLLFTLRRRTEQKWSVEARVLLVGFVGAVFTMVGTTSALFPNCDDGEVVGFLVLGYLGLSLATGVVSGVVGDWRASRRRAQTTAEAGNSSNDGTTAAAQKPAEEAHGVEPTTSTRSPTCVPAVIAGLAAGALVSWLATGRGQRRC